MVGLPNMTKIYWTFTSLWAFVVYAIIVENMNNFPHFPAMQKVSNAVCKRISHLTSLQIISSSDQRGCTLFFLICSSNFSSCTVYTVYSIYCMYVFNVRVYVLWENNWEGVIAWYSFSSILHGPTQHYQTELCSVHGIRRM